jgi:hypothetical protein
LIDGVREHIAEARVEMPDETDAALLTLLDRLGDPADLAQQERERLGLGAGQQPRVGLLEIAALVLTLILWPVGVILLWASGAWSVRDKLIGTLLPPGGLFTSYLVFGIAFASSVTVHCGGGSEETHRVATTCSGGGPGIVSVIAGLLLLLFLVLPIITSIYLAIRLRRRPRALPAGSPA